MKIKRSNKVYSFAAVVSIIYFSFAFFTLHSYGQSWDETIHYRRGQVYLHFFLTGKTDYSDLSQFNLQGSNGEPSKIPPPRRSIYQNDYHNLVHILEIDGAHGPISDELASLSNYIFYQKLGIISDLNSYHLFIIFVSSIMVFLTFTFTFEVLGFFPALISTLALMTYPLFWSESHFNIKDPIEATFFLGVVWTFWKSLNTKKPSGWLILCTIFLLLAIGTKLNIAFIPFIFIPYLIIRYVKFKKLLLKPHIIFLTLAPLFSLSMLIIAWPFLWGNTLHGLLKILIYYKDIGTSFNYQPQNFYLLGFNTFPIQWIIFTTPPIVLFLSSIGIISFVVNCKKQHEAILLWILLLFTPIARVTIPGSSIYGGVRQIFEFIPALAMISAVGAKTIYQITKTKWVYLVIIILFISPIKSLIKYHPYENTYFNFLIGGLKGASEKNFPSSGNSFGTAYKEGVNWINSNAEKNAKLSLIQGTMGNLPTIWIRKDIDFQNSYFSGINRKGEYLMELTFNDTGKSYYYAWEYVDKFLNPVYEIKVDNTPILKVWKNDLQNTKANMILTEKKYVGKINSPINKNEIKFELSNEILLSRFHYDYVIQKNCEDFKTAYVETSVDGNNWVREKDWIPFSQIERVSNKINNSINFYFAAKPAKYIKLIFDSFNSCGLNNKNISIYELK